MDNMEMIINNLNNVIHEIYDELLQLPKPQQYRIGGTYYGSTELHQSVGNHLNLLEDSKYTIVEYGGFRKHYNHVFGIRIGGAYKISFNDLLNRLLSVTDNKYCLEDNLEIFYEYGTNFSVMGYGIRER